MAACACGCGRKVGWRDRHVNQSLAALKGHFDELDYCITADFDPIPVPKEDLYQLLAHGVELEEQMQQHLHGDPGPNRLANQTRLLNVAGEWLGQMRVVYEATRQRG